MIEQKGWRVTSAGRQMAALVLALGGLATVAASAAPAVAPIITPTPAPSGTATSAALGAQVADWAQIAAARLTQVPLGLPAMPNAANTGAAAIALGRKLFFDRRLSLNGTMSCAMCHVPEQAFANNELAVAIGINGLSARRNAPTSINVGFYQVLFQDGREFSLETQFFSPLLAANEMGNPSVGHVIAKLNALDDYRGRFEAALGGPPGPERIGQALAAYQRSLVAGDSRFDRWLFGAQADALSPQEQHGYRLFTGKAGCSACHQIADDHALFTDQRFHDNGYGWMREQQRQRPPSRRRVQLAPGQFVMVERSVIDSVSEPPREDLGRYEITLDPVDRWRYRTPQLRNVALTAPFMHDGGFSTLAQVLAFYNQGGAPHPGQSPLIRPLGLNASELDALQAWLGALNSPAPALAQLVVEARSERPDSYRRSGDSATDTAAARSE